MKDRFRLGPQAAAGANQWSFEVWAPHASQVDLCLQGPEQRSVPMERLEQGYWRSVVDGVAPGQRYRYRLDGQAERPDPASRFQPEGVHGLSEVIAPEFPWEDQGWFGLPLRDYVIYELHVGTFTREGTFDAIIPELPRLKELGITALELMPIAQFPGARNWGYDGVGLYAAQNSYGGPLGLKRLVNACHQAGLAVVLDVVYNHFGPEGNYLREFGPYFNEFYKTLWGAALNFDGPQSDHVREFFLENALYWQTECHVDALRLDAVHAIRDFSAVPFLEELAEVTHGQAESLNRRFYLIAESDLNNPRLILPQELGGFGLDAQWSDDFHHCLHVLLTNEATGYYEDFGGVSQLARIFREGYAYIGQYSPHRQHRHGKAPRLTRARQFVVYAQNHDQVGNRLLGDRLAALVGFESLKLAAGTVILSPFIPLLFMGEEYGEPAPFQYITSHSQPALVQAVREGRRREFAHFHTAGAAPDPQAEETFLQNKLHLDLPREHKQHRLLQEFYRELLRLRRTSRVLAEGEKDALEVEAFEAERCLVLHYSHRTEAMLVWLAFGDEPITLDVQLPRGNWTKVLDSAARDWDGPGDSLSDKLRGGKSRVVMPPHSVAVFSDFPDQ